jgi:hypothetical protein
MEILANSKPSGWAVLAFVAMCVVFLAKDYGPKLMKKFKKQRP